MAHGAAAESWQRPAGPGKGAAVDVVVPGDEDATVHFSLESGHPDLYLIVDGELHPQPAAAYELAAGSEKTFNVAVVNLAHKASDSEPGYANVTLAKPGGGPVLYGTVQAGLHAEKTYETGRPKINVHATFAALEGFQSCMQ